MSTIKQQIIIHTVEMTAISILLFAMNRKFSNRIADLNDRITSLENLILQQSSTCSIPSAPPQPPKKKTPPPIPVQEKHQTPTLPAFAQMFVLPSSSQFSNLSKPMEIEEETDEKLDDELKEEMKDLEHIEYSIDNKNNMD